MNQKREANVVRSCQAANRKSAAGRQAGKSVTQRKTEEGGKRKNQSRAIHRRRRDQSSASEGGMPTPPFLSHITSKITRNNRVCIRQRAQTLARCELVCPPTARARWACAPGVALIGECSRARVPRLPARPCPCGPRSWPDQQVHSAPQVPAWPGHRKRTGRGRGSTAATARGSAPRDTSCTTGRTCPAPERTRGRAGPDGA
jgi:hypothetical protein